MLANNFKSICDLKCTPQMHCFGRTIKADDNPSIQTLYLQPSGFFVSFRCFSGSWLLDGQRQVPESDAEQKVPP